MNNTNTTQSTSGPMFQVQMTRYGEFVCDVGSPYPTRAAAEQACSDSYRADWERSGQITPTTHYLIGEVRAALETSTAAEPVATVRRGGSNTFGRATVLVRQVHHLTPPRRNQMVLAVHPAFIAPLKAIEGMSKQAVLSQYVTDLRLHDWSFEYSDHQSVWQAGTIERKRLEAVAREIDPEFALWNANCPAAYRRQA